MNQLIVVTNLYPSEEKPFFGVFVKAFCEGLINNGWDVRKVTLGRARGALGYLIFYLRVIKVLAAYRGIVYVHYVSHSSLPVLIASTFNKNIKIILNFHGSDGFSESFEKRWKVYLKELVCKWAIRSCIKVVAPSEVFGFRLRDKYQIPIKKIFISASGGVRIDTFREAGLDKTFDFCFAGRLIPGKGVDIAVSAIQPLVEKNVSALFVGDGPLYSSVKEGIRRGCVLEKLLSQTDLANRFSRSKFFLFPSVRKGESLGLVVFEALACGAIPIYYNNEVLDNVFGKDYRFSCSSIEEFYLNTEKAFYMNEHERLELLESLRQRVLPNILDSNVAKNISVMLSEVS